MRLHRGTKRGKRLAGALAGLVLLGWTALAPAQTQTRTGGSSSSLGGSGAGGLSGGGGFNGGSGGSGGQAFNGGQALQGGLGALGQSGGSGQTGSLAGQPITPGG